MSVQPQTAPHPRSARTLLALAFGSAAGAALALAGGAEALSWLGEAWGTWVVDAFGQTLYSFFMC